MSSLQQIAGRGALVTLLVSVAIATVPYGSVLPSAQLRLQILAAVALVLASVGARTPARLRAARVPFAFGLALLVAGILQLVPLAGLASLSPSSVESWEEASRLLSMSGSPEALVPRISIAPQETAKVVLLLGSYLAIGAVAILVLDSRWRRRAFVVVLLAAGLFNLAWGVVADRATAGERVHGTFVNPNHLAGYLTIPLFVALAMLITAIARRPDPHVRNGAARAWVTRALFVLLWATIAGALAITKSRGAILAVSMATVAVLLGWSALAASRRRVAGTWLAAFCAIVLLALTLGSEPILRFLSSDPREVGADTRVLLWSSSIDAWKAYPILGAGLGAFRDAYRPFQPAEVEGLVEQAHSEALQLAVTGGWVGLAAGAGLFIALLVVLLRGAASQSMREERALAIATAGAIGALLLHGLVEFNLSVPAIPFTLAAVWGMAAAGVQAGVEEARRD